MTEINFDTYNAWIDSPDPRDIRAEDILDMVAELPSSIIHDHTPILNQGSIWACTVFGSSSALFETSAIDAISNGTPYNQPYDPWKVWDKAKERGASDTLGWSVQWAIQLIHDLGYSIGYARVSWPGNTDPFLIKRALANGYVPTTGSAYGDWGKIIETGIYSEKSTPSGHCFDLNGFDDNYVFPSGEKWGFHSPNNWDGRGAFWIPYSMIKRLYTTYIQLDPSDIQAMRDYRNIQAKLYAEKSKAKLVWNGSNSDAIATDEEIRIMLSRAIDIMGARSRQYWATMFSDKILRGKWLVTIWNEKDGARNATDVEIATMFTRAVKRDPKASSKMLTRFQVSAVIGRDLLA